MRTAHEADMWMASGPNGHGDASVGTPSWLAPRLAASVVPVRVPNASQPPASIMHMIERHAAAAVAKSSVPPMIVSAPSVPAAPAYPDLRDENAELRAQLAEAAVAMATLRQQVLEATEPEVVRLACAIAERACARELRADPAMIVEWAREGLTVLASKEGLVVAIAEDLIESIPSDAWVRLGAPHRLEVDASLSMGRIELRAGGARVEVGTDARLGSIVGELGVEKR